MTSALALVGDWNAEPHDTGRYSPEWIAAQGGLRIHSTGPGRHGDIDYLMADCHVSDPERYESPAGSSRSDHDVVMFTLYDPLDSVSELALASWNVEFGRPAGVVKDQLHRVLRGHLPHVLALQEAADYHPQIRQLGRELGYRVLAYPMLGRHHNVLMVRTQVPCTRPRSVQLSPLGWPLADGTGTHAPLYATSWAASWLRVVDVHMPPNVNWSARGIPYGPPRKLAAYVAGASKLARWSRRNRRQRKP